MRLRFIYSYFLSVLITVSLPAFSQNLLTALQDYNKSFPQEKMHIHFDKSTYLPEETIWFKAYLTAKGTVSIYSSNLYVELMDSSGKVVDKKVLPVFEATAAGSFDIPSTIKGSSLVFKAYTTTMLNADSSSIYLKQIQLFSPTKRKENALNNSIKVQFFPEGGNLVSGIESVIAFKATGLNNLPVPISGVIKEESGRILSRIETTHNGMGQFRFTPLGNTNYYAEWKDESGLQKTKLPAATPYGFVLEAGQDNQHIEWTLRYKNVDSIRYKQVHLIALMGQQLVYEASIKTGISTSFKGTIDKDSLITGIVQLTLFDGEWKPIAERIVFVNKDDYAFTATISQVEKNLGKRGKNTLEIEVPDPLRSNLSLAVTDARWVNDRDNIVSRLLLTDELRGYIHEPDHYFSRPDRTTRHELDLVMLTNGWRRYNWDALRSGQLPPVRFGKDTYLTVTGKLKGLPTNEKPKELALIFKPKSGPSRILPFVLNDSGDFVTQPLLFFDTASLYYKNPAKASTTLATSLQDNLHAGINDAMLNQRFVKDDMVQTGESALKQELSFSWPQKQVKTLEEVRVKSKTISREQEIEKEYASDLFQNALHSFNFIMLDDSFSVGTQSVFDYLNSKVPGLSIEKNEYSYIINRRGGNLGTNSPESNVAFFLNELPVEISEVAQLSVSDIAYIKVINPPFIAATIESGGAIAIYLKNGGEAQIDKRKQEMIMTRLKGYSSIKEFYAPDYSKESFVNNMPDYRSTLYWNPYILTDKNSQKVKVDFYNNDISNKLIAVLEGINEEGKLIRIVKYIQ